MELIGIVRKLVGPINPVGETNTDNERYENLKAMTELVDALVSDIDRVIPNKRRSEYSMKRAGEHADEFFNSLGIGE